MLFLTQPSSFISAWHRHQDATKFCAPSTAVNPCGRNRNKKINIRPTRNNTYWKKVREAGRSRLGHVLRKENNYFARRIIKLGPPCKWKRGKRKRFVNAIKDDVNVVVLMEKNAVTRERYRKMVCWSDP